MEALTIALTVWIATQTGLSAPEPPRIAYVADGDVTRYYHALAREDVPLDLIPADHSGPRVLAFYMRDHATIYLPRSSHPASLRDRSILVHELVHHVQRHNGLAPECPGALERQAYDLQATWLREQGVSDPFQVMGVDQFTMLILTACMPPDH